MAQQEPARRGDGRGARAEPDAGPDDHAGSRPDLLGRIAGPLAAINRAPLTSYHVVMVVTALLTVIGLGMALSSSNVPAISGGGTPFDIFLRQAVFVAIGWVGFVVALRMRFEVLRAAALPMLLVSIGLLIAVLIPGVGMEINGSRSWIDLGFFGIQPAEIAKLAFIVWASSVVAKRIRTGYWLDLLFPAIVGYGVVAALVVVAPDLGMATAVTIAFLCVLWFSGYPTRHFVWVIAFGTVVFGVLAVTFAYRFERIRTFFNTFVGDFSNPQGSAYQSYQGMLSLADGGLFGVGLGQSSAKWFYLPEATNDFIFAIIGEELGMIGCLAVIGLFGLFVYTGLRIAMRSVDPFLRLLTAGATCWVFGQAMINIGYVVGLLPVTGLQLPLVSYGGTSTAITLLMFGIIASAARHEPEAIAALHAGQEGRIARALRLPLPAVFSPKRAAMARSKSTRPTLAAQDRTRLESRKNKDGRGARSPEPGRTRVSSSRVDTAGPNGSARNAPRGHARRAEPQRRDTGSGYAAGPRSPYRPRPEPQPGRPPVRSGERGYRR